MAGEVVVDALPYFDQGYDEPGVREAVRETFNGVMSMVNKPGFVVHQISQSISQFRFLTLPGN